MAETKYLARQSMGSMCSSGTWEKIASCKRLLKTGCNNIVEATLFLVVNNIEQYCGAEISPQSAVTMPKNIVDNMLPQQCCPNNIVVSCFQKLLIYGCVRGRKLWKPI